MLNGSMTKENPYLFTYLAADSDSKEQAHVQLIDQSLSESMLPLKRLCLSSIIILLKAIKHLL